MGTLEKNKIIVVAVIFFILAMIAYYMFFKPASGESPEASSVTSVGDELVNLRRELGSVSLDRSDFSSQEFLLLTDFSVVVPDQTVGRSNPFNLIGRD